MKRLSHTSGRGGHCWEVLQSVAARLWCICSEGIQTFVGYSFRGLVNPWTAPVFAESRYLQPEQIYWQLRRFLFEWPIFSSPLTAEVSAQTVQPSLLKRNPSDRAEAALPHSGPTLLLALSCRDDFKPRWFQHFEYEDGVLSPSLCSPPHLPHLRKPIVKCQGPVGAVNQTAEGGDVSHGGHRTLLAAFRLISSCPS